MTRRAVTARNGPVVKSRSVGVNFSRGANSIASTKHQTDVRFAGFGEKS